MFQNTTPLSRGLFSLLFVAGGFLLGTSSAYATVIPLNGFGWSADDNIQQGLCDYDPLNNGAPDFIPDCVVGGLGWLSFSNLSDATTISYGVYIDDTTGDFSGYAWGGYNGWVTFNALEMQKCATVGDACPPGTPKPKAVIDITIDPVTGAITGTGKVTGWARFCSVFVSGCSGALRPNSERGGWDGWVSLSGPGYGWQLNTSTFKFSGYAWGGGDVSLEDYSGFGWIDASKINAGDPPPPPPLLSFFADPGGVSDITIVSGQSAILHWTTSAEVTSCNASGDWSGSKVPSVLMQSETTAAITTPKTYGLQCQDSSGKSTPLKTVTVSVIDTPIPIAGACGTSCKLPSRTAPASNLCSSGRLLGAVTPTTASVTNLCGDAGSVSGDKWVWTCEGINGGGNETCYAPKKKSFRVIQF